ncbi:myelin and lymphocyte protein-like [Dendropsophus ebraccatus]|uniref:myelin and lymphocyte protein-like n=1 Tax=Dendropsophus ebraccatus TaxID=150705 RepID=UPI003831C76A
MASTTTPPVYSDTSPLPSGIRTLTTFPDFLMILEFVFGGLVWILVASTRLFLTSLLQGWVMFVSVTLFAFTTVLLFLYIAGVHKGRSSWTTLDAFYHYTASLMYLSAAVLQAATTVLVGNGSFTLQQYQENIAAVVFAFLATLVYVIHAVASLIRWKRSP